jgi:hypothetical protein
VQQRGWDRGLAQVASGPRRGAKIPGVAKAEGGSRDVCHSQQVSRQVITVETYKYGSNCENKLSNAQSHQRISMCRRQGNDPAVLDHVQFLSVSSTITTTSGQKFAVGLTKSRGTDKSRRFVVLGWTHPVVGDSL